MKPNSKKNISIQINGLVQGVGFRPFVYRTAIKNGISGWVKNRQDGVAIAASGSLTDLESFVSDLKNDFPLAAQIQNFQLAESAHRHKNGFRIILSEARNDENEITQIGSDIAVCNECLQDLKTQQHRLNYPFINCTNCGPRFSIICNLPYDRRNTTMNVFEMCPVCKREYKNPLDRRFHAQPVACLNCGPHYTFISENYETEKLDQILKLCSEFIDAGKIVAIKGIGGFFIACDATNPETIKRLRKLKNREEKPFAVMFENIGRVKQFCFLNKNEEQALSSWRRPIVILKSKRKLPVSVSNGISTVGALLPYMPFHYLLFDNLITGSIVFTSGNYADEPIVISSRKAESELFQICDAIVSYNRQIYNRSDDSVLQLMNKIPRLIRRSRGWVPNPVYLNFNVDGILATGAELKNTFCLGKGKQAILSQHIGDLKDFETWSFYEKNIRRFQKLFSVKPELVVTDLHMDYFSTKYALESGLRLIRVQHHHAHIVSAMAENGLDEKVIGVSFDGTGLGDDGNIWGSEFFVCDLVDYERKFHFEYVPLPGGDAATKEPWRLAVVWLYKVFGTAFLQFNLPFLQTISDEEITWVLRAIDNKINCPLSSASGRLFDAVSALLGLCNVSSFEAKAPTLLENIAAKNVSRKYSFKLSQVIEFSEMFSEIIIDLQQNVSAAIISAKFHNTVSEIIVAGTKQISAQTGLKKVVLSGGTFQNRYLLERTENRLNKLGFEVFCNCSIPCNDGGISLGQLAIAAKRRSLRAQSQLSE